MSISYEQVKTAIIALEAGGAIASDARIREYLGGRGSYSTIGKHRRRYRDNCDTSLSIPIPNEVPASLFPAYEKVFFAIWHEAVAAVKKEYAAKIAELSEIIRSLEAANLMERENAANCMAELNRRLTISDDLQEKLKLLELSLSNREAELQGVVSELAEQQKKHIVAEDRIQSLLNERDGVGEILKKETERSEKIEDRWLILLHTEKEDKKKLEKEISALRKNLADMRAERDAFARRVSANKLAGS